MRRRWRGGDLKWLHQIDAGRGTPRPEIVDHALPGRLPASDHGTLRRSLARAPLIAR